MATTNLLQLPPFLNLVPGAVATLPLPSFPVDLVDSIVLTPLVFGTLERVRLVVHAQIILDFCKYFDRDAGEWISADKVIYNANLLTGQAHAGAIALTFGELRGGDGIGGIVLNARHQVLELTVASHARPADLAQLRAVAIFGRRV